MFLILTPFIFLFLLFLANADAQNDTLKKMLDCLAHAKEA